MTKTVRAACLLFFALYLLFSIIAVAYDYHDPSHSKARSYRFMRRSLWSVVGPASFVPQVDDHPLCLVLVETREPLRSAVFTPGVPYRGPPLREGSFLPRLS